MYDAKHLRGGLIAPEDNNPHRQGYELDRVQVDLMDVLWSSDYEIGEPVRWTMEPFNNDWLSSIFLSLDPAAIELVSFDFLRAEFTIERILATHPQMEGVDDYLHQTADSISWPNSVDYDPENDGILLPSLGVHEHWNDEIDKQYSWNLGTGLGIELITISPITSIDVNKNNTQVANQFVLYPNYPNPFNPVTNNCYEIPSTVHVELNIYNIQGQLLRIFVNCVHSVGEYTVSRNGVKQNGNRAPSGIYVYQMRIKNDGWIAEDSQKMSLIK
ncbi:MAG: T9SS type A sorting domain-containing protein [bacterium]|nr:MAG: T9SS type A sorting domain-containing protein [bacterium]